MKQLSFALVILVLLLTACSDDSPVVPTAGDSQLENVKSAPQTVTKPFKGRWTTTFGAPDDTGYDCDGEPDNAAFIIEGSGVSTHLGQNTLFSLSESDFVTQCGHTVHTAANGDQLEYSYAGTVDQSGFPAITFTGEFWFTGGTGRFEGATGGGTYEGSGHAFDGVGEVSNIGMLTLPKHHGALSGEVSTVQFR